MSSDTVAQFEESLQGVAETCQRVRPESFEDALREAITEPAVGAPLPFDGVSISGTPVTVGPSVEELDAAETGVTPAGLGIANYGTVTVRSRAQGDELVSLYPPRHVVVVSAADIVPDMPTAFERFEESFAGGDESQVLATGPSATADMGSLVQGVHGPRSVHVIVVEGTQ